MLFNFCDLVNAFDCVDHFILIQKRIHYEGIKDYALR